MCTQNRTSSPPHYVKNVQYRTSSRPEALHYVVVKTRKLTAEQISSVPCATCGAAAGEVCDPHPGAPRPEPHRDRKLAAADAVEAAEAAAVHAVEVKSVRPQSALRLVAAAPTS